MKAEAAPGTSDASSVRRASGKTSRSEEPLGGAPRQGAAGRGAAPAKAHQGESVQGRTDQSVAAARRWRGPGGDGALRVEVAAGHGHIGVLGRFLGGAWRMGWQ